MQSLLHPSLKSQIALAKPGQPNSVIKTGTSGDVSPLNPSPAAMNPAVGNTALPVQSLQAPAVPTIPVAPPLQPGTIDEAKLQAVTLGAEQNQSAVQIARIGTATASPQVTPSAPTGFQQLVSPQSLPVSSGTTGITGAATTVPSGTQSTPLSPASPELPPADPKGTVPNASVQTKPQQVSGLDLLSVAAGKKEAAPLQTEAPKASSALANQPAPSAQATKPTAQPGPATPQAAGTATPPTNAARPVPIQPEHSVLTTEAKAQAAPAIEVAAGAAPAVPQIPLQSIVPDINVVKISPKPAEAPQTAPTPAASPAVNWTQPAIETSKKNGDTSGGGNSQSGTGKDNALSSSASVSATAAANSQTSDGGAISGTKISDVAASTAPVAPPIAHPVMSSNESGTSARTDVRGAETLQSVAAGTPEADARVQAATTYANSLLHSARLVERIGQTELRVGIQAGEFGNVDIRTSMVRNQFTAQISVERGDLGKVLAAELPSLQNKLSEQRLPMANITLQNQSSGGSAGFGQGSRQSHTMQQSVIPQSSEGESVQALMSPADASSAERLDVHM